MVRSIPVDEVTESYLEGRAIYDDKSIQPISDADYTEEVFFYPLKLVRWIQYADFGVKTMMGR